MKKLIVMAVAIVGAVAAHAAAVSWALEKDSAKTYGGLTAYVVNGADYSAIVALLATGGVSVAADFNAYVINSVVLNSRGAGADNAVGVTGDSLAWFIFEGDSIADGSSYSTTGVMDVSAYKFTPPESAPGDFGLTVDSFTTKGATIGNVPEPTSGLLMLLGMVGLALRRKQG